jgi:hypothetical protein
VNVLETGTAVAPSPVGLVYTAVEGIDWEERVLRLVSGVPALNASTCPPGVGPRGQPVGAFSLPGHQRQGAEG